MKFQSVVSMSIMLGCASMQTSGEGSDRTASREKSPIEKRWDEAFMSPSEETYRAVTGEFEAHLAANPEDRESRNRYGKLLYAQGRWQEAAEAFEGTVNGSDHFSKAAARNSILAWRRVIDRAEQAFRPLSEDEDVDRAALNFLWDPTVFDTLGTGKYVEAEMPLPEQRLAEAVDRYVAIAEPTDEALPTIQLISANSYFRYYRFADSADRCLRITERWPRLELAVTCANVITNMFSATEDLAQLERYGRAIWQNRALMQRNPELRNSLEETLHFVSFQNAWSLVEKAKQKKGDEKKAILLDAAEKFRRYQDEFPNSPHADKALYNALAQYLSFGVKDEARTVATLLVEDYPQSPVAKQARQVLAKLGH